MPARGYLKSPTWVSRSPVNDTGQAYRDTANDLFSMRQRHEMVRDALAYIFFGQPGKCDNTLFVIRTSANSSER